MLDTTRWEKIHGKKPDGKSYWYFIVNIIPEEFDYSKNLHRFFVIEIQGAWNKASKEVEAKARSKGLLINAKDSITNDKEVIERKHYLKTLKSDTIYLVP